VPALAVVHITLVMRREALLGESPLWDDRSGRLYWVDIRAGTLEWIVPTSGRFTRLDVGVRISALGVREGRGLIAAADHSVGILDSDQGRFEPLVSFEPELPRNRTNDGGVGQDGRFWFGTMDDGAAPGQGGLYSVGPDWILKRALGGLDIPNGIVTAANGTVLYMADSGRKLIETRALDPTTGVLQLPKLFADFADDAFTPDGAAVDEEGCLWSALWDGGRIVRLTPDGRLDGSIDLPVSRPTSCAFGGPNLGTLYVTSARGGLKTETLEKEPLAGSVFAIETGVRGAPVSIFAG
jgi:L-arabinonolactonase